MKNVVFQHSDWEQKKVWKKGKYVHRCTVKERIRMSWFVRGVRTVRGQWLFRAEGNGKSFVIEMCTDRVIQRPAEMNVIKC